jgi:hypothetical protein
LSGGRVFIAGLDIQDPIAVEGTTVGKIINMTINKIATKMMITINDQRNDGWKRKGSLESSRDLTGGGRLVVVDREAGIRLIGQ